MGHHSHDDVADVRNWEGAPPVAPPGRACVVASAAMPFAVIAGTRWEVSLLTSLADEQPGQLGSLSGLDAVSGIGPAMMERLDGFVSG